MKKTTILVILMIYLISIVAIGFFGMSIKVYDEIKYVKSIEVSVVAENVLMYKLTYQGLNEEKNRTYKLEIYMSNALTGTFARNNGILEEREYIPLTFMPYVTYDTGDIANAQEDSIVYSISNEILIEKEYVSLSDVGVLICFKRPRSYAFVIYVDPATKSGNGTSALIYCYVV